MWCEVQCPFKDMHHDNYKKPKPTIIHRKINIIFCGQITSADRSKTEIVSNNTTDFINFIEKEKVSQDTILVSVYGCNKLDNVLYKYTTGGGNEYANHTKNQSRPTISKIFKN